MNLGLVEECDAISSSIRFYFILFYLPFQVSSRIAEVTGVFNCSVIMFCLMHPGNSHPPWRLDSRAYGSRHTLPKFLKSWIRHSRRLIGVDFQVYWHSLHVMCIVKPLQELYAHFNVYFYAPVRREGAISVAFGCPSVCLSVRRIHSIKFENPKA